MFCLILKYCKTFKMFAKPFEKSKTNSNKNFFDELDSPISNDLPKLH